MFSSLRENNAVIHRSLVCGVQHFFSALRIQYIKKRKYKQWWNMVVSKLGPEQRGRAFAGRNEPLSLVRSSLPRTVGREERQGESQEKVQVTLFFFLEANSGWTQGDARQFTKSQALLSHFSKPRNLETGPQPTIASSAQTALFHLKIPACLLVPSLFGKSCSSFWLTQMKCQWITA